jgi:hypothetical protein
MPRVVLNHSVRNRVMTKVIKAKFNSKYLGEIECKKH